MHFSISIGKSNAFISCLLIWYMKLTLFRKHLLIFWQIFCDLTFYLKIQCVSAFLSQNPMRSLHAIILSQNQMRFSISIAKSNAFFSCLLICSMKLTPFQKQPLIFLPIFCDLTFYRKILCIFAFLSKNPMRSFHAKS